MAMGKPLYYGLQPRCFVNPSVSARTGAVTLIQRFGSALNLNTHFHMLFLNGVSVDPPNGAARFCWVTAASSQELTQLAHTIVHRVGRFLEPKKISWTG
jgi:hypothetical protein